MAAIDPLFVLSNRIEAGLWIFIALCIATRAGRNQWLAILTFLAFGISDIVEASTGAWWRPWWLLVWKGVCVAIFLLLLIRYRRINPRKAPA